MPRIRKLLLFALIPLVLAFMSGAARAEKRVALVIGNAGYQAGALTTPANDAGLIADAAGSWLRCGRRSRSRSGFAAPGVSRFPREGHSRWAGHGRVHLYEWLRTAA